MVRVRDGHGQRAVGLIQPNLVGTIEVGRQRPGHPGTAFDEDVGACQRTRVDVTVAQAGDRAFQLAMGCGGVDRHRHRDACHAVRCVVLDPQLREVLAWICDLRHAGVEGYVNGQLAQRGNRARDRFLAQPWDVDVGEVAVPIVVQVLVGIGQSVAIGAPSRIDAVLCAVVRCPDDRRAYRFALVGPGTTGPGRGIQGQSVVIGGPGVSPRTTAASSVEKVTVPDQDGVHTRCRQCRTSGIPDIIDRVVALYIITVATPDDEDVVIYRRRRTVSSSGRHWGQRAGPRRRGRIVHPGFVAGARVAANRIQLALPGRRHRRTGIGPGAGQPGIVDSVIDLEAVRVRRASVATHQVDETINAGRLHIGQGHRHISQCRPCVAIRIVLPGFGEGVVIAIPTTEDVVGLVITGSAGGAVARASRDG